jgi:hypothetical protein
MGGKASIILVFGFGLVLSYISWNLHSFSSSALVNMTSYYDATASHELALSGANVGVSKIYMDTTWTGPLTETCTSQQLNGSFDVWVFDAGINRKIVRSVSSYSSSASGTLHDTIDVYFNTAGTNSLTLYAWMTNNTGNVFWSNGDTVWGRAHSNGMSHISGSPVFMDKATTAKKFDPPNVGKGTNQAYFKNGYETGVAPVPMPTNLSQLTAASNTGGRHYTNTIAITLDPGSAAANDGVAYVKDLSTGTTDTVSLSGGGFNGVILSNGNVSVQGTLDGKLTVTSLTDIRVTDNIYYERDPRHTTSNDMLGLVAEHNVIIADNTENNADCTVMGSILARTGSLVAQNLTSRPLPLCGTLTTFGSIIQDSEQEVGTYNAKGNTKSNLTNGYSKSFRYDARLMNPAIRPPFFPGYSVPNYSITNWWESYRVSLAQ